MSINSLTGNPSVLLELSNALNLISPTTGITVLNGDNNITTTVTGNTGAVKLNTSLLDMNSIATQSLTITNFENPFYINQPSTDGQVLSSSTTGNLSWVNNGGGGGSAGSLINLANGYEVGGQYTDRTWLPILGFTFSNATVGQSYYVDIQNYIFTASSEGLPLTIGLFYGQGASPVADPPALPVTLLNYITTGTSNNLSTKLQYTVQDTPNNILSVWVGSSGASISSNSGCSYSVTGII